MDFQNFLVYAVITILMAPLLLVYGLPFIAAATLFHRLTRHRLADGRSFIAACGIAAAGIAPAYDMYRAPLPIYVWLMDGRSPGLLAMVVSFGVTWALIAGTLTLWRFALRALRGAHQRGTVMPAACPRVNASSNTE
jgi:hypothetical protein